MDLLGKHGLNSSKYKSGTRIAFDNIGLEYATLLSNNAISNTYGKFSNVDSDGNVYLHSISGDGNIYKFDKNGNLIYTKNLGGSIIKVFCDINYVYVLKYNLISSPTNSFIQKLNASDGSSVWSVSLSSTSLYGMDVDDTYIYISLYTSGAYVIKRYNKSNGTYVDILISPGTAATNLQVVNGYLYFTNSSNPSTLYKYTLAGVQVFTSSPSVWIKSLMYDTASDKLYAITSINTVVQLSQTDGSILTIYTNITWDDDADIISGYLCANGNIYTLDGILIFNAVNYGTKIRYVGSGKVLVFNTTTFAVTCISLNYILA